MNYGCLVVPKYDKSSVAQSFQNTFFVSLSYNADCELEDLLRVNVIHKLIVATLNE